MNDGSDETARLLRPDLPFEPTVLIVDDDDLVLARLKELVTAAGYRVRTATSGLEALMSLETSQVSIVVTDLNMPTIDGLEMCRRIRALARSEYVYIILLTVRDDEQHILAGLAAGADEYISKRTSAALFTARLRTANRVLALEYSLKNALEQKSKLAMTDDLTGIYNRRYFNRHLNRELKRRQTFGGDVSLLLLDVDHFKKVNDQHGHSSGDAVLKGLTKQIAASLRRETDWCARLGGEEFGVVLEDTKLEEAYACAERMRESIANHRFAGAKEPLRVTVSIGVSGLEDVADRQAATVVSLLALADEKLFVSKVGGRNRVTCSIAAGTTKSLGSADFLRSNHANANAALSSVR
jgi:diguanylate cyclase (GGDEF)-like protein